MIRHLLLVTATAALALASAEPCDAKKAPPLLTVEYSAYFGPAPVFYTYAIHADGRIEYEAKPEKDNAAKTTGRRLIRRTPNQVLESVNVLLAAGFMALKPRVVTMDAERLEDGRVTLYGRVVSHSQSVTLAFSIDGEESKTTIDRPETFPWMIEALQKVERDLGIAELIK